MDRADSGGAEGVCDEAAGRIGGDGQRQEAEGGQGHPLPGSGCVGPLHYNQQQALTTVNISTYGWKSISMPVTLKMALFSAPH